MKDLVKYINENIKDKLSYFVSKKLLPEQWDTKGLDNDYYVIPIGTMRIDSGDKFTIIPFVIHKKSLYHCGPAWRGMTFVKTKEDVEKYLLEPVKNALK